MFGDEGTDRFWKDIDASELDHVVSPTEHLRQTAVGASASAFAGDKRHHVVGIETDHRCGVFEERSNRQHALLTVRLRCQSHRVYDFSNECILEDVHSAFLLAVATDRAEFVGPIIVVDVGAPLFLKGFTIVDSKPAEQPLQLQIARVKFEFIARNAAEMPDIGRKGCEEIDLPGPHDLDLTTARGLAPGAGDDRDRARVFPEAFAKQKAGIRKACRQRNLDPIKGTDALQVHASSCVDIHHLAVTRRVKHGSRKARRAAAGLQYQRHWFVDVRIDADQIAPWRMPFDAVAEVVNGKGGQAPQVIETFDVASFNAGISPVALVERDRPGPLDLVTKTAFLQAVKPVARHHIDGVEILWSRRELPP